MRRLCHAVVLACSLLRATVLAAATFEQDCEMCGLLVWRMEAILAMKREELKEFAAAKEMAARKGSKAQTKKWLRAEAPVAMVEALETYLEKACDQDSMLLGTVCRAQVGE